MKLDLSPQIFEKCSNIKFHKNLPIRNQVVSCGQRYRRRDRHSLRN